MSQSVRHILITGADGFIGKNLRVRLGELPGHRVLSFLRSDSEGVLPALVAQADAVVHLAGENRPTDVTQFEHVNAGLTQRVCDAIENEIRQSGRQVPLVLASSTQASLDNPYGQSKLAAERIAEKLAAQTLNPVTIFRLPGVFGKWCRPHYNSVVATFCHQAARGLPLRIDDARTSVKLAYIDDVVSAMVQTLASRPEGCEHLSVHPEYEITLGELAAQIKRFASGRQSLHIESVGTGLVRALYATFVSYLPNDQFAYDLPVHSDYRGAFVEMLKTPNSGQFSYFTAHPGVTRGGHYHHTKTEKFLVIKGEALFRFRHLITGEMVEFFTHGEAPRVVDTVPGWSHDITNAGDGEMIVMLWANENFDPQHPDTVASKVKK